MRNSREKHHPILNAFLHCKWGGDHFKVLCGESWFPIARDLLGGDVQTIPGVDIGNCDKQCCELLIVVVTSGFVPNGVSAPDRRGCPNALRIRQSKSSAFASEKKGVSRQEAIVARRSFSFAFSLQLDRAAIQANAAAIDLADTHMHQFDGALWQSAVFNGGGQRLQRLHGLGK
jgi:hypothetical protein